MRDPTCGHRVPNVGDVNAMPCDRGMPRWAVAGNGRPRRLWTGAQIIPGSAKRDRTCTRSSSAGAGVPRGPTGTPGKRLIALAWAEHWQLLVETHPKACYVPPERE